MKILHTDGQNSDFISLCRQLDENLNEIVGGAVQREKYDKYNQLDDIKTAVLIYIDGTPAACGSFKHHQDDLAEIKRIFVRKEYRGSGLSKTIMGELETEADKSGYRRLLLETGNKLDISMNLYRSIGFKVIENYGQYKDMAESVCMEKILS